MAEKREPKTISGTEARQGYVVLRTPLRRVIFFGGLAAIVVLSIVLMLGW